ncbi:MAG: flagellar basal-body MS-ring/collar protein FliF [Oleiphilaceae bacterium]|nr:flagellar basal-body MS-ring/collar protein FliF [Oleiphilaceae bacterium]
MATVPAETSQSDRMSESEESRGPAYEPRSNLLFGFNRLSLLRQVGLMVGLAASVALGLALVLWAQEPSYQPLLGDISRYDPDQVTRVLDEAGIQYKVEPRSGALLVASGEVYDARLRLARDGVTENRGMGFEMLMEDQGLGTSQFMEQARYRHSLEGELARTIASMGSVRSARVHLAVPRESVFVRDNRNPSASVFVDVASSHRLSEGQVASIVNLVAGSVPQMLREDVTVVDQRGNLLSRDGDNTAAQEMARHMDINSRVEENLARRVNSILTPILGSGRFKAEVSAQMDFSQTEQAEEIFNPDQQTLRSEQTMVENRQSGDGAGGIPGALANQPPGAGQVPEEANGEEGGNGGGQSGTSRRQSTRNYEVDRTLSFTRNQPGSVQRLSVAVAVDDLRQVDPQTGEVTQVAWPEQELERLTRLVQDAVGFSAARGDSVTVVNTPFAEAEPVEFEPPPFWQQPWFQDSLRPVVAGIVILMLALFLVRPTLKNLASNGQSRSEGGHGLEDMSGLGGEGGESFASGLGSDDNEELLLPDSGSGYDRELNAVKGLIAEDPARVSQVVRQWVNADE